MENKTEQTIMSVTNHFKDGDDISVSLIQRKCILGYNKAASTFEELCKRGFIEKSETKYGVSKFITPPATP